MTTFAPIGAGPGPGLAAARRLGTAGHHVAPVSRNARHQDEPAAEPARDDITARGFTADALAPENIHTERDAFRHYAEPMPA